MRTTTAALLILLLTGCTSPQGDDTANLEGVDTLAEDSAVVPAPGADVVGEASPDSTGAERTPDEGEAVQPTPVSEEGELPAWTAGRVSVGSTATRPPVRVTAVRPGRHSEFDRVVIDLGGDGRGLPGYRLEYVDRPLHECGSGQPIQPVGNGWLRLRLEPAAAHTEAGEALLGSAPLDPGLPQVMRIYRTCDFEGVVELVLAVASPEPFRAFHLDAPRRIVVDVRR